MGDIIGSVLGTSTSTTQQTVPDEIARAQNLERLNQLVNLFAQGGVNQFAATNPEGIYNPTDLSTDINSVARNNLLANQGIDYSNLMSLDNYRNTFNPVTDEYANSLNRLQDVSTAGINEANTTYNELRGINNTARDAALARSYSDYNTGRTAADTTYTQGSADVNAVYNAAIARGDYDLARSIALSESGGQRALDINEANFNRGLRLTQDTTNATLARNEGDFQRGLGLNESNLLRSLGLSEYDAQRSLGLQDANRARALELGIGATGNYIDQIATPRLNAALTLQGLESGGAVPAAIARATAETAMPYLQSIENTYGTNQANTLNSLMGLRGELTGNKTALDASLVNNLMQLQTATGQQRSELENALIQQLAGLQSETANQTAQRNTASSQANAQGNVALGGQALGAQASLAGNYQNNVNQLAQALMANNITLEQAGISANSALGQQLMQVQNTLRTQQQQGVTSLGANYTNAQNTFAQTLPAASQTLSLLPGQMRGQQAAYLTGLQSIADFPRQLQEADYLRRQGLFTTAYTGIPYTPGSTTFGGTATGNIFDQLGGTIQSGLQGGGNIGG